MENKMFNNLLMALGVVCLMISLITREDAAELDLVLMIAFSFLFAIGYVGRVHLKMLQGDSSYATEVNDERNVLIQTKTGNTAYNFNQYLLVIVALIFLYLEYYIPAIVVFGICFLQPVLLIILSKYYSKKI